MMKNIFLLLFFCGFIFINAQNSGIQSDNSFNKSEQGINNGNSPTQGTGPIKNDAGNPGDPLPVNQYITVLALVGVGIIVAVQYRRRTA